MSVNESSINDLQKWRHEFEIIAVKISNRELNEISNQVKSNLFKELSNKSTDIESYVSQSTEIEIYNSILKNELSVIDQLFCLTQTISPLRVAIENILTVVVNDYGIDLNKSLEFVGPAKCKEKSFLGTSPKKFNPLILIAHMLLALPSNYKPSKLFTSRPIITVQNILKLESNNSHDQFSNNDLKAIRNISENNSSRKNQLQNKTGDNYEIEVSEKSKDSHMQHTHYVLEPDEIVKQWFDDDYCLSGWVDKESYFNPVEIIISDEILNLILPIPENFLNSSYIDRLENSEPISTITKQDSLHEKLEWYSDLSLTETLPFKLTIPQKPIINLITKEIYNTNYKNDAILQSAQIRHWLELEAGALWIEARVDQIKSAIQSAAYNISKFSKDTSIEEKISEAPHNIAKTNVYLDENDLTSIFRTLDWWWNLNGELISRYEDTVNNCVFNRAGGLLLAKVILKESHDEVARSDIPNYLTYDILDNENINDSNKSQFTQSNFISNEELNGLALQTDINLDTYETKFNSIKIPKTIKKLAKKVARVNHYISSSQEKLTLSDFSISVKSTEDDSSRTWQKYLYKMNSELLFLLSGEKKCKLTLKYSTKTALSIILLLARPFGNFLGDERGSKRFSTEFHYGWLTSSQINRAEYNALQIHNDNQLARELHFTLLKQEEFRKQIESQNIVIYRTHLEAVNDNSFLENLQKGSVCLTRASSNGIAKLPLNGRHVWLIKELIYCIEIEKCTKHFSIGKEAIEFDESLARRWLVIQRILGISGASCVCNFSFGIIVNEREFSYVKRSVENTFLAIKYFIKGKINSILPVYDDLTAWMHPACMSIRKAQWIRDYGSDNLMESEEISENSAFFKYNLSDMTTIVVESCIKVKELCDCLAIPEEAGEKIVLAFEEATNCNIEEDLRASKLSLWCDQFISDWTKCESPRDWPYLNSSLAGECAEVLISFFQQPFPPIILWPHGVAEVDYASFIGCMVALRESRNVTWT